MIAGLAHDRDVQFAFADMTQKTADRKAVLLCAAERALLHRAVLHKHQKSPFVIFFRRAVDEFTHSREFRMLHHYTKPLI